MDKGEWRLAGEDSKKKEKMKKGRVSEEVRAPGRFSEDRGTGPSAAPPSSGPAARDLGGAG